MYFPTIFPSLYGRFLWGRLGARALSLSPMTIPDAFRLFLSYGRSERGYAKESLDNFEGCYRSWIAPTYGEPIEGLSDRLAVLNLRSAMTDKGLGTNRQYAVLMFLKLLLKFCRKVLKIPALDPAEVQLPKRERPYVQFLTNEEVKRMIAAIPTNTFTGLRLRTLVEVLLSTGLRIGEALALDRAPFERGERVVEIIGKGSKRRVVFFTDRCLGFIRQFLNKRDDDCPAVFVTTGFPRRLARSDISKTFIQLRREAQIDKPLTPHLLRHTYCTNLLHNGADITFIKELAGHKDIQTTARYYLEVDRKSLRNVVDSCLNYERQDTAPLT